MFEVKLGTGRWSDCHCSDIMNILEFIPTEIGFGFHETRIVGTVVSGEEWASMLDVFGDAGPCSVYRPHLQQR